MHQGLFVAFEGIDGTGKTTQRDMTADRFEKGSLRVTRTFEPGGTHLAMQLRDIVKYHKDETISTVAEALLFYTARELHLTNVIRPHLADNKIVFCDRFADSTEAYQMAGGKLDPAFVQSLRKTVVGDTEPDLTFVFVMDIEKAFARAEERGEKCRMEAKGPDYYIAAQQHFVKLAHQPNSPTTYVIISADQPIDVISDQVCKEVAAAWDRKHGPLVKPLSDEAI